MGQVKMSNVPPLDDPNSDERAKEHARLMGRRKADPNICDRCNIIHYELRPHEDEKLKGLAGWGTDDRKIPFFRRPPQATEPRDRFFLNELIDEFESGMVEASAPRSECDYEGHRS